VVDSVLAILYRDLQMKPAKCHPDKKAVAKGMCMTCYGRWRYHNVPEYRKARIASACRRQKKNRKPRPYQPCVIDIPPRFEGVRGYKWHFTAKDDLALEACLKRRGLASVAFSGWRKAA